MLIRHADLDRIVAGEIDTAFRRQKRPTVRAGGTLRTAVGMLDILAVDAVDEDDITLDDARRAGFDDIDGLVASLVAKDGAAVYRVRLRRGGADPRDVLRADDDLTSDDVADLAGRLDGMDRRSPLGPWTRTVLGLIAERPHVRAPDLAASIGWETAPFKANVRKLKALGLTISHSPGYELSPRGHALLAALSTA